MDINTNVPLQKFACRAIALDLDGTLTNHDKEVTPLTRKAILKAQKSGVKIILASGRPTYGILPVAKCLNLKEHDGYILSYNGGKIVSCKTHKELFSQHIPEDMLPIIYTYAKEKGYALLGYSGQEIITESPDDEYVQEESRINKMPIKKVYNLLQNIPQRPTKLLMTGSPKLMITAEKEIQELLGNKMNAFRSSPFFIELVPRNIDKSQSLIKLLGLLGISPEEMMAFGDGYNDISMLKLAGMGIAMANAAPEVRAEADYVTLSNEEDGIAYAIEKFLQLYKTNTPD